MAAAGCLVDCNKTVKSWSIATKQKEQLAQIAAKHLQDEESQNFANSDDYGKTSTERGVARFEHQHLIVALDVLNTYQRNRKACLSTIGPSCKHSYRADPRTKTVELLKRWLRTHALDADVDEAEVRMISGFTRDLLNFPELWPSRNERSFMRTMAEVYEQLQHQLREVLKRDRTCAELVRKVLALGRNLLSDAICILMCGPTCLKETDDLPSMEVFGLWQSMPRDVTSNLPVAGDERLQKKMKSLWDGDIGQIVLSLVTTPGSQQLFGGQTTTKKDALTDIASHSDAASDGGKDVAHIPALGNKKELWQKCDLKHSGLCGPFKVKENQEAREVYLKVATLVRDLAFLLGGAFTQFQRIGSGLGDYGMIRMSPWLHPFLAALDQKVKQLKINLERLNGFIDDYLVLAKARGLSVPKPLPTQNMLHRAHEAFSRCLKSDACHTVTLLGVMDQLKARSSPERMPTLMEELTDACTQLQMELSSAQFLACVGDELRDQFPPLLEGPSPAVEIAAITDVNDGPHSFEKPQKTQTHESNKIEESRNPFDDRKGRE